MNVSNFKFIQYEWTDIFDILTEIESYLYTDPNISLIKLRQLEEAIFKEIIKSNNISLSSDELGLKKTISILLEQKIIPVNISEIFNKIRIFGNKASHENYTSLSVASELLEKSIVIIAWFISYYSKNDYSKAISGLDTQYKLIFQDYLIQAHLDKKNSSLMDLSVSSEFDLNSNKLLNIEKSFLDDSFQDSPSNLFKKDVFETNDEFLNRLTSYNSLNVGIAKNEVFPTAIDIDVVIFNVEFNNNAYEKPMFHFFYTKKSDFVSNNHDSVKFTVSSSLTAANGKAMIDENTIFIENGEQRIKIYPVLLDKKIHEDNSAFNHRLKELPPLPVGLIKLLRNNYDIDTQIFPCMLTFFQFAKDFCESQLAYLSINRHLAKHLSSKSLIHPIMATFKVINNEIAIADIFIEFTEGTTTEKINILSPESMDEYAISCLLNNKQLGYELLKISAKNGSYIAEHLLGGVETYEKVILGEEEVKNIFYTSKMISLLNQLADTDDHNIQSKLGEIYQNGLGVEVDHIHAHKWFALAADQGNPIAQSPEGVDEYAISCLLNNKQLGYELLKISAKNGSNIAKHLLGGVDKHEEVILGEEEVKSISYTSKMISLLNQLADANDHNIQSKLGEIYENGLGVEVDYIHAHKWFALAAEQGNPIAQNYLGYYYLLGEVVAIDYNLAHKWFSLAAEQGYAFAQTSLGYMYQFGEGIAVDYNLAHKWYSLAAEQGDAYAQTRLGYMYHLGEGVAVDYNLAHKWYSLAAEQGDAEAQTSLGNIYYYGEGVKWDYGIAQKWYSLAAEQGNADAQNSLGNIYYYGKGIAVDYGLAQKWYSLAAHSKKIQMK